MTQTKKGFNKKDLRFASWRKDLRKIKNLLKIDPPAGGLKIENSFSYAIN